MQAIRTRQGQNAALAGRSRREVRPESTVSPEANSEPQHNLRRNRLTSCSPDGTEHHVCGFSKILTNAETSESVSVNLN